MVIDRENETRVLITDELAMRIVCTRSGRPWLSNQMQRRLEPHGQPVHLVHLQLGRPAGRQLPVEVVEQARQRQLHGRHGEPDPGAPSPPAAERHEPEVLRGHHVVRRQVVAGEPLRHELVGAIPRRGVARDGPRIDDDAAVRRNVVAEQLRVTPGL